MALDASLYPVQYTDLLPKELFRAALHADIRHGLTATPRATNPVWLYDEAGSFLHEEITRLPEFYPSRTEDAVLRGYAPDIAAATGVRTLVDLGSGSSQKARALLDSLCALQTYVPIDVSVSALGRASVSLAADYPFVQVAAMRADFNDSRVLAQVPGADGGRLWLLLGGTIGNYRPAARAGLLRRLRQTMGSRDALLLSADLVKSEADLVAAYDDAQGVTAAFNLNLLAVLNRELDAGFDANGFAHRAVWDSAGQWVEMRLRSLCEQTVHLRALDMTVQFGCGQEWITKTNCTFTPGRLRAELAAAGLTPKRWWTDQADRVALTVATPV